MKKILVICLTALLCVCACFALSACNNESCNTDITDNLNNTNNSTDTKGYTLTVRGNYVVSTIKEKYTAGETVTVITDVIMDADLEGFLDDVSIGIGKSVKIDGEWYWEYSFVMPARNAVLKFKVVGDGITD